MEQQDISPSDKDLTATEKERFWTVDRVITCGVLAIAVVVVLIDYRVRTTWESDFEELLTAVTMAKTPGLVDTGDVDLTLVDTIRSGAGVSRWLEDRGYVIDQSLSSDFERIFSISSGIRTCFVNVDVRRSGIQGDQREEIILVSREDFYAWNSRPGTEQESIAREDPEGAGSRGGQQTGNAGGGGGQQGGSGRGFDPEQIFTDRDKDMDGLLTGEEISERLRSGLQEMDKDDDGAISKDEFLKAISAMMAARQQRGGGGGGGGADEAGIMSLPDDPFEQGELGFPDANALPEDIEKLKKKLDAGQ
ncbi:MAG: hypothetical protein HOB73_08775 [Planctomycetaceae bacterium]|jgi:hypothetical protein|nr:hypothetical protein [Planctomycetaceae bacterium]